jgi:hypothetical protein
MSGLQGQGLWDGTGKSEKDQLLELNGAVNAIMSAVQTLERTINVTVKDQFDDIGTKLDFLVKAAGKAPPLGEGAICQEDQEPEHQGVGPLPVVSWGAKLNSQNLINSMDQIETKQ